MNKKLNNKMIQSFLKSMDKPDEFEIVIGGTDVTSGVYVGTPNPHKWGDGAPVFKHFYEVNVSCKVLLQPNQNAILHIDLGTLYVYDQFQNWWVQIKL